MPQYHPVPENDEWWGRGFTEWRNVAQAVPRFRGHYQPHRPADLGYYDLRVPETRAAQAALAQRYGVDAFCYYHYWFNGRRLLERPVQEVLSTGEPDQDFMLCWANENWTRTWDGASSQVLVEQVYDERDDLRHIEALVSTFADERYIRLDGKPVFLVYKVDLLPDPIGTTERWRTRYKQITGEELFLCTVDAYSKAPPHDIGFDAAVEFQPNFLDLPDRVGLTHHERLLRKFFKPHSGYRFNNVYEYEHLVRHALARPAADYPLFRGVTPSWDNSPRRASGASIFRNSSPALFEEWVHGAVQATQKDSISHSFLFINAWNEWAEGSHLEPDDRYGLSYLEAHRAGRGL